MRALLSLEGEIRDHIDSVTHKDRERQKWLQLGEEQILNVVKFKVSEVDL